MIDTLFEAARWAPSCYGDQPWRYVYATKDDGDKRAALEGLLAEGNAWAKNAYLLIVSFAKTTFNHNGKPNAYHMHDTGCASGYLVLQATHMNLVSHQMAGFAADKANGVLGVPTEFVPGSMIAIGYPGDPKTMDEGSQKRDASPRTRKPLGEIAFRGGWKA
jgi:nitroreductase